MLIALPSYLSSRFQGKRKVISVKDLAPVVRKPINANPRLNRPNPRSKFILRLNSVPRRPISTIQGLNWGLNLTHLARWINNGNWTEWRAIWSEIIRVISKSNERAARVRFEITSMISDQNCTTRSSITTLLNPFWNRPNTGLAELRRFSNKKRNGSDHYSSCARAIFGY